MTRTGGFSGLTMSHEVDVTASQLDELRASSGDGLQPVPDAFTYEITTDSETFHVADALLLDKLLG